MNKPTKTTNLKIKKVEGQNEAADIQGAINSIKHLSVDEGLIPRSSDVVVNDFAGKELSRTKSIFMNNKQYFVKAGTKWEDISRFHRRHIKFGHDDFK